VKKLLTPAAVGALLREARNAAGISQSELGARIGASRFWVAQFEKGKPTAELGLALKALHALGLMVRVEPRVAPGVSDKRAQEGKTRPHTVTLPATDLAQVIANSTIPSRAVLTPGWPAIAPAVRRRQRGS